MYLYYWPYGLLAGIWGVLKGSWGVLVRDLLRALRSCNNTYFGRFEAPGFGYRTLGAWGRAGPDEDHRYIGVQGLNDPQRGSMVHIPSGDRIRIWHSGLLVITW